MIYLDLPKNSETWESIQEFNTRKEAIQFMKETWGESCCSENGELIVLTGTDEKKEDE